MEFDHESWCRKEGHFDQWLNSETSVDDARDLLEDNRGSELVSDQVSRNVNSSSAKGSHLIDAL